jgi:plastocyanin
MRLAPSARRTGAALTLTTLLGAGAVAATTGSVALAQASDGAVKATAANKFEPATIQVNVGGTVTWTNEGGFHTVTGGSGGSQDPASPINGQLQSAGQTYAVTFDKAGTYDYFCQPHLSVGMVGKVVVGAAPAGGAAGGGAPTSLAPSGPSDAPTATQGAPTSESTASPQQGGQGVEVGGDDVPGIEGNPVLEEIAKQEEENAAKVSGFVVLVWGMLAAALALGIALFFSTRTRRPAR